LGTCRLLETDRSTTKSPLVAVIVGVVAFAAVAFVVALGNECVSTRAAHDWGTAQAQRIAARDAAWELARTMP
jgi:hypothetical protein